MTGAWAPRWPNGDQVEGTCGNWIFPPFQVTIYSIRIGVEFAGGLVTILGVPMEGYYPSKSRPAMTKTLKVHGLQASCPAHEGLPNLPTGNGHRHDTAKQSKARRTEVRYTSNSRVGILRYWIKFDLEFDFPPGFPFWGRVFGCAQICDLPLPLPC